MKTKIFLAIAILISLPLSIFAKLYEINGLVTDENKVPIKDVFVKLTNTPYSTLSDSLGRFTLVTNLKNVNLKFIHNSYEELRIDVDKYDIQVLAVLKGKMNHQKFSREMRGGFESRSEMAVGAVASSSEYSTDEAISSPLSPKESASFKETEKPSEHGEGSVVVAKGVADFKAVEVEMEDHLGAVKDDSKKHKTQANIKAGQLTAGELNDFSKWKMWKDLSAGELDTFKMIWNVHPVNRFTVQIANEQGLPVIGAKVRLYDDNQLEWSSVTDNTGKAELWDNPYMEKLISKKLTAEVEFHGKIYKIDYLKKFTDGINFLTISYDCSDLKKVDVAFIIDATGSMGDEINYLKSELYDIMQRAKDSLNIDLQLGSVFYRDRTDDYLFKYSQFSSDLSKSTNFIKENAAGGGGDFPEAIDIAMDMTLNSMKWRDSAFAKIVFIVLDAPPHEDSDIKKNLELVIKEYSKKGIRIVPIVCSGTDKSTEYLMRSMAMLTNGTYVFLTDDSGIGDKHIKPSTDNWNVEMLNDLVYRLIYQYTNINSCAIAGGKSKQDTMIVVNPNIADIYPSKDAIIKSNELSQNDSLINEKKVNDKVDAISWKYYPNPCYGIMKIDVKGSIGELFITDISGKILIKIDVNNDAYHEINLSEYPSGTYFIRYEYAQNKWLSGKFILMKG
jgi:hypothetical protein